MKYPNGMIFIYHPHKDGVNLEQKELIMCKDCKHWRHAEYYFDDASDNFSITWCDLEKNGERKWSEDDFCSRAERKE